MENISTSLVSLTNFIPPLLVFIASCYYLFNGTKTADAILLFIGSGIGLLVTVSFTFMPRFIQSRFMPYTEASQYYALIGMLGFLGGICFAVGFFILISNLVNTHKQRLM